jgi:hypothetical protein
MTSARRTQDDLKKILGVDSQGSMFAPWEERAPIPASRGIWQSGDGSTKSGTGPGTNDEGEAVNPVKPDDSALNDNPDGSGGGGGGGTGNNDGSEFIVPDEVPPNFDSNDDLFGGDWGAGGVSTYKDCADDTCIKLNKSEAFVPPEGWLTPDEGPIDPDYVPGRLWTRQDDIFALTPVGAFRKLYPIFFPNAENPERRTDFLSGSYNSSTGQVTYRTRLVWITEPFPPSEQTNTDGVFFVGCAVGDPRPLCDPNSAEFLAEYNADVQPQYWPDDGCIQLANIDGQWQSHPKESPNDITTKYSEGKSILDLCTPSGDGVQILPGIDGGTVEWNYTKGIFLATSPDGRRSFGGATEVTAAVAGTIAGGGYIKQVGAPTGS